MTSTDEKIPEDGQDDAATELPPSGILLVDKPIGWSSHDVVNVVRRATGVRRVGHAGTLDPLATGLLVVLIGKDATRLQDEYMGHSKEYEATVALGVTSETDDAEGPLHLAATTKELETFDIHSVESLFPAFLGEIQQRPPAHSAIQVGGQRLYRAARKGTLDMETIPMRTVQINNIELGIAHGYQGKTDPVTDSTVEPLITALNELPDDTELTRDEKVIKRQTLVTELTALLPAFTCIVQCEKGTYIRSLARDIGDAAGIGGFLSQLRRTRSGNLSVSNAFTIKQIRNNEYSLLLPGRL